MSNHTPLPADGQRRLVQRILNGGIPSGDDFDACRKVVTAGGDATVTFKALFTLLEGALADPFFPIDETERVVPILRGLARGEIETRDLL